MSKPHRWLLVLAYTVIAIESMLAIYYSRIVFTWLSDNWWVVVVPFSKVIFKKLAALKLVSFLKALIVLLFHLSKLLLLKLFKTLTVRYGVFFSQHRWYWIRWAKVMFLRRGRQAVWATSRFWSAYHLNQKRVVLVAFFPIVLLLILMGLSFNITRKTMVEKAQESAVFEMAASAGKSNRGVRAWVSRLDDWTLKQIRHLTPRSLKDKTD